MDYTSNGLPCSMNQLGRFAGGYCVFSVRSKGTRIIYRVGALSHRLFVVYCSLFLRSMWDSETPLLGIVRAVYLPVYILISEAPEWRE